MIAVSPTTLQAPSLSAQNETAPDLRPWTTPHLQRLGGAATNSGVFPMETETCTGGTCYGPS